MKKNPSDIIRAEFQARNWSPEQYMWAYCLLAAGRALKFGHEKEKLWIRSNSMKIGSFMWICTQALDLKNAEAIREQLLDDVGKTLIRRRKL